MRTRPEALEYLRSALAYLSDLLGNVDVSVTYTVDNQPRQPLLELANDFQSVETMARAGRELDLTVIPTAKLDSMCTQAEQLVRSVEQITAGVKSDNVFNGKFWVSITQQLHDQSKTFGNEMAIAFILANSSKIINIASVDAQATLLIDRYKKDAERIAGELTQAFDGLKQRTTEAAAAGEAEHFQHEADGHWAASWVWLVVTIIIAASMVLFTLYAYRNPVAATNFGPDILQRIVAKIVLLSLLSGLLVFCGRNYSTSRHNYITNQHRAVALTTFRAFMLGTNTTDVKDKVLTMAARAAFTSPSSGYLRKDSGGLAGPLGDAIAAAANKAG